MAATAALIVAAGSGSRAGGEVPKQYRRVAGKPVLRHAFEAMSAHPAIGELRVAIGAGQEELYREALAGLDPPAPVLGGEDRGASVVRGLEAIQSERVLIHDAARPFCPASVIDRLLAALDSSDGAVPILPLTDSLARGGSTLAEPVDRSGLVRVQTPQAFATAAIRSAYRGWAVEHPSDDSAVAAAAGLSVAFVAGDPSLDKLTFPADFERAEAMLAARYVPRTGFGFDVHAFAPGDGLWLGGVRIPHDRGLAGHSDSDVALHALTDAILGAIGAGDLGDHFPSGDPRWRGAASSQFLEHARDLAERSGGRIVHCDLTIVCEAPRIGPHRDSMRALVAALLRVPIQSVSIKATTTDRLGFAGRGEGIAAHAVATVLTGENP